jgi:hypothetical protein
MEDMTHAAIVTRLGDVYPIKGADFIHAVDVQVNGITIATIVTGKDHITGELGIYFSPDLQLSEPYCEANNLVAKYDEQGNKIPGSGFFNEKRRVTAQRFKGAKSEGLWMPLNSLSVFQWDGSLTEGDRFTEINGIEICKRYPKQVRAMNLNGVKTRKEPDVQNFAQHYDTPQLIHALRDIERLEGATVYITEKMHGTSHRVGNVPVRITTELPLWKRLVNKIWKRYDTEHWEYRIVHGTRRTILNDANTGYYGSHDFRYNAVGNPELQENEVLYGEIVGWVNENTPIMPPHNTSALKEVKKVYGDTMYYDYGVEQGKAKFYVYRITRMNEDGISYDMPYEEMVARTNELGYEVPVLLDRLSQFEGDVENLKYVADVFAQSTNGIFASSKYGNHISEGVVLLFNKDGRTMAVKHKSYSFKVFEGIYVEKNGDIEDGENNTEE